MTCIFSQASSHGAKVKVGKVDVAILFEVEFAMRLGRRLNIESRSRLRDIELQHRFVRIYAGIGANSGGWPKRSVELLCFILD